MGAGREKTVNDKENDTKREREREREREGEREREERDRREGERDAGRPGRGLREALAPQKPEAQDGQAQKHQQHQHKSNERDAHVRACVIYCVNTGLSLCTSFR